MATRFPNVVVVNPDAAHHIVITVDRPEGRVRYVCSCGVDANIPICDLDMLKSIIRDTDNAQVLAWIEHPDV
jgi:CDGSH-type Zn-finger protein